MPIPQPNTFQSWKFLDDDEEIHACLLNGANVCLIQNEISMLAQRILNLVLDPYKPLEFIQSETYLKGQIGAFQWLLDGHNKSIELSKLTSPPSDKGN